jgi:uracil-DNA glycosylase
LLTDAYIAAAVRCAPPDNKPTPEEIVACQPHLEAEIAQLPNVKVVVALGKIAFDVWWRILASRGFGVRPRPAFGHGASIDRPALPSSSPPTIQAARTRTPAS